MHYLDYAATTPVSKDVADAMYSVLTDGFGNPSSQYALGREASAALARARKTIADALGCAAENLHFTSCGTEGDNWALAAALYQNRRVGKHIITTAVEHHAVSLPCRDYARQGYELTVLRPDSHGRITLSQLADALREDTAVVSMMLVNNELGTVYPVAEVAQLLRERGSKALLHTDAVQAFGKLPFRADTLGADFVTISAHKLGAPKGVGALYISSRVPHPRPLLFGGGQESGLRPGTEATAQIVGFARAVELHFADLDARISHMAQMRDYAREKLCAIPGLVFIADAAAPHILSISLPGYPSQNIVSDLDAKGIYISAGSACHRGKPSDVVAALDLPKRVASGVVRISFSSLTTTADIDALADALDTHRSTRFPML